MRILVALVLLLAIPPPLMAQKPNADELIRNALIQDQHDTDIIKDKLIVKPKKTSVPLDDNGRPTQKPVIEEPEEGDIEITIQKMFRPGRYRYGFEGITVWEKRLVYKVSFASRDVNNPPAPPPGSSLTESGLNKTLNNMHGNIYIDQETGSIVRFEAHLNDTVSILGVGAIYEVDATYEQQLFENMWVQKEVLIIMRYNRFRITPWSEHHRQTVIDFIPQLIAP